MTTQPPHAASTQDEFPDTAWANVSIEVQRIAPLPMKQSVAILEVRVVNDSTRELDCHSCGPLSLHYHLFDFDGRKLELCSPGTPVSGTIPPKEALSQTVEIHIPTELNERVASARIRLGTEDGSWVSKMHRGHSRPVLLDRDKCFSRLQEIMLTGARIWPLGQSNGLTWPSSAMMVSERHKLLYIPVAKCACTSLKSAMLELAGVEQADKAIELGVHLVTDRFNTGAQLKDKSMKRAWQILASTDYFKFMVVRQPFQRLVSAYLEKFVYNRYNERNLLHTRPVLEQAQDTHEIDLDRGISFDDFLSVLMKTDPHKLDPHWRPQHLYRQSVKHHITTVKLENIKKLETVLSEATETDLKLAHRNQTRKSEELITGIASLSATEVEKLGSINPDSFESSKLHDAARRYYERDLELYQSAE